jgi:hypothetical protein
MIDCVGLGIVAGAAGTVAFDVTTYGVMLLRGRAARRARQGRRCPRRRGRRLGAGARRDRRSIGHDSWRRAPHSAPRRGVRETSLRRRAQAARACTAAILLCIRASREKGSPEP